MINKIFKVNVGKCKCERENGFTNVNGWFFPDEPDLISMRVKESRLFPLSLLKKKSLLNKDLTRIKF